MRKIKVADLKPGMMYDQPVYIDPSNVLVQARQELQSKDIERLFKWGIKEVETNGQLIQETAAPAPVAEPLKPVESSGPVRMGAQPEAERVRIHSEYEQMRKAKQALRNLIKETADLIQVNIQALTDNKPFDNHAILSAASRLVDDYVTKPYMLLVFPGLRIPHGWSTFHAIHGAAYGVSLATALNYSRPKLHELMFSMLLMDAGMLRVPPHVREKNSAFTEGERGQVKTHPLLGYQLLLKNGKVKANLATVALQHHEAFDGSGYPQGLKSGQIEEMARIASIADTYTAMIESRPYRPPHLPYDAMKHMLSAQMNRFDPRLLRTFLGRLSIYPVGSIVQLSTGKIGLVMSCKPDKPLRPLLRVLRDEKGLPVSGLMLSDLIYDTDVYIVKALDPVQAGIDMDAEI